MDYETPPVALIHGGSSMSPRNKTGSSLLVLQTQYLHRLYAPECTHTHVVAEQAIVILML